MKTCVLLISFLCCMAALKAQYGNEWIDYSKTYYKCKVGQTGFHRIGTETLLGAGLSNVPAEQFQLWHNGQEVRLYTSAATGVLPAGGFIEFYGEQNDGAFDDKLYKNVANHLNKSFSLQTDTSAYFLTVSNGTNLRYANTANNVQGNTLPAEPYFLYTYQSDFRQALSRGKGFYYGETIYSSTYDAGEFWSSADIADNQSVPVTMSNLNVAGGGPAATLSVSAAGESAGGVNRRLQVSVNNTLYINQPLPGYSSGLFTAANIPLSLLSSNTATITITNRSTDSSRFDNLVAGIVHLTYPHTFNMGGARLFAFMLPASVNGNYLEVTSFNGGGAPVLYDVTNGERYAANNATPGILKFRLTASSRDRSLVLVNEDVSNLTQIVSISRKKFTDYSLPANQGDYLIISNCHFIVVGQRCGAIPPVPQQCGGRRL